MLRLHVSRDAREAAVTREESERRRSGVGRERKRRRKEGESKREEGETRERTELIPWGMVLIMVLQGADSLSLWFASDISISHGLQKKTQCPQFIIFFPLVLIII